jgi:hypothetical protein
MGAFFESNFPEGVTGRPFGVLGSVMRYGARPIIDRVIGAPLDEREIRRRIQEVPRVNAEQAAADMHVALRRDDVSLLHFSEARLVSAVVKADEDTGPVAIPPEVTRQVIDIAAAAPLGKVEDNPLISPEDAGKLSAILDDAANPQT